MTEPEDVRRVYADIQNRAAEWAAAEITNRVINASLGLWIKPTRWQRIKQAWRRFRWWLAGVVERIAWWIEP